MWGLVVMLVCNIVAFALPFVCAILCFVQQIAFSKFVLFVIFAIIAVCSVLGKIFDPAWVKKFTAATGI